MIKFMLGVFIGFFIYACLKVSDEWGENMKEDFNHRLNFKNRKRDLYKNTTKEQRAKELGNIICFRCKYQNHRAFIIKYGKCHLCGAVLDKEYFKRSFQKKLEKRYEKQDI